MSGQKQETTHVIKNVACLHQLLKKMHCVTKVRIIIPPGPGSAGQMIRHKITGFRLAQQKLTAEQIQHIPTVPGKRSGFSFCDLENKVQILQSGKALARLEGSEKEFCSLQAVDGFIFFDRHTEKTQGNKITCYGKAEFEKFCIERSLTLQGNCPVYQNETCQNRVFQQTAIVLQPANQTLIRKINGLKCSAQNLTLLYYLAQNFSIQDSSIDATPREAKTGISEASLFENETKSTVFELAGICAPGDAFIPVFQTLQGPYFVEFSLGGVLKFGDALERQLAGKTVLSIGEGTASLSVW